MGCVSNIRKRNSIRGQKIQGMRNTICRVFIPLNLTISHAPKVLF